ncbi:MAG: MurR/RpiR family transcriptional regulator [Lachnospiraceae bacterium]|nr:MurR/RpiR family transcriptional regulator [Lachnospiraceae bacterium]
MKFWRKGGLIYDTDTGCKAQLSLPHFHQIRKKIADYLSGHADARYLSTVTLDALASDIGVGQASIIRFVRKCGYESYRDFMASLGDALYNKELSKRFLTFQNDNTLYQSVSSHLASCAGNLSDEDLALAASFLENCSVVLCYGEGYSDCMAQLAYHRLSHNNIFAVHSDKNQMYGVNPQMMESRKQTPLLLLFSVSGETESVVHFARQYRAQTGVHIISFTCHVESSLAKLSDVTFYAPSSDEHHEQTNRNIDGIINMIFLMDSLLIQYYKINSEKHEKQNLMEATGQHQP